MHVTYLHFPSLPREIEEKILFLADNSTQNYHSSEEFLNATSQNNSDLNISASDEIIKALKNQKYDPKDSLGFHLSEVWSYFSDLAEFDFLEVSEEIKIWVQNNITEKIDHISIQSMHGGKTITPHIDEMRKFAFNYIIDTGGDTSTCFWKPKKEFEHLKIYAQTVFPYDRLNLIEEIKIEKNRWHKLDTGQIHSVENLDPTKKRISLSLSVI